jgi:hypothetical protein
VAVEVTMQRAAPIFPVRDVTAALTHYRQLGFDVRAYGPPGEANPEYGFVRWGEVELHLSLSPEHNPKGASGLSSCRPTPGDKRAHRPIGCFSRWPRYLALVRRRSFCSGSRRSGAKLPVVQLELERSRETPMVVVIEGK